MSAPKLFQFKLVLLGDSAVGKSSLVLRFVRGQFFEYQESTIGGAMPPTSGRCGSRATDGTRGRSSPTRPTRRTHPPCRRTESLVVSCRV